jgi:competence protein ComEC
LGTLCLVLLPQIISSLLFQFAAWVMGLLWKALEYLAGLEHGLWVQHAPVSLALAAGLIGAAWLLMPRGWPARWVGTIGLLPLFLVRPPGPSAGEVWLTLLDVGQGLAAVVRTHQHALIFDTGARFSARFDAGRAVLVPYLHATGVDDLDVLLVSHGDNDHIGGAQSLLAAFPAKHILSGVPERLPDAEQCHAGQTWRWDDVDFTILNPPEESSFRGNNAGCALLVTGPHGTLLLPADIETEAEQSLLEIWNGGLHADVLVAPHHGSKTSSTEAFIDAVQPQLTLLPVGYRNRYKHPHPTVVERYQQRGIRLLDSPASGAITVKMGQPGMEVSSYRQDAKRYWFTP